MKIPFNALDREITRILKGALTVEVTDHPDTGVALPFVVPGDYRLRIDDTKTDDDVSVVARVEAFSEYKGKKELNTILEEIADAILAPGTKFDLSPEGMSLWARRGLGSETTRAKSSENVYRHGFVEFEFRISDS